MMLTHFVMNIALGKLPDPDLYISSYNTAKNLSLIIQSTGVSFTFVVTTFVVNDRTFKKVIKYAIVNISITALLLMMIGLTPLSGFIFKNLYNLSGDLLDKAVISIRFICFFSIAVCIRVLFVGFAIKLRYNPLVSLSAFLRLVIMIILNFSVGYMITHMNIDNIPGFMILLCGITETLVIIVALFIYNKDLKGNIISVCEKQESYDEKADTTYKAIFLFTLPLILSFGLRSLAPSVTNSALALTEHNEKVIAAYSIAVIVANVIGSIPMSFQHVIINHNSHDHAVRGTINKFAYSLIAVCCGIMFLLGFTKFGDFILINVLNTLPDTAIIAKNVLKVLVLNPMFVLYTAYYNGFLLKIKKTNLLIFERVLTIIIPYSMFFFVDFVSWDWAAVIGGIVLTICSLAAGIYNNIAFKFTYKKMIAKGSI